MKQAPKPSVTPEMALKILNEYKRLYGAELAGWTISIHQQVKVAVRGKESLCPISPKTVFESNTGRSRKVNIPDQ